jgi:hypothetical protein
MALNRRIEVGRALLVVCRGAWHACFDCSRSDRPKF